MGAWPVGNRLNEVEASLYAGRDTRRHKTLSDMEARAVEKTLPDALAKNRGRHTATHGEVDAKKLLHALANMLPGIEADNFLRDRG